MFLDVQLKRSPKHTTRWDFDLPSSATKRGPSSGQELYDEFAQWADPNCSQWHVALKRGPSAAWDCSASGACEVATSIFINAPRPLHVLDHSCARKQLLGERRRARRLNVFASAFLPGRGVVPSQTAFSQGYSQWISHPLGLEGI